MKEKIEYYSKRILYYVLHVFWIFPVKKHKIMFTSFAGKSMNCNPFYIYHWLKHSSNNYQFVWVLNDESLSTDPCVNTVRMQSLSWLYHICTSGVFITNGGFQSYLPFRKSQLLIDTYHGGGAYKKAGIDFDAKPFSMKHLKRVNHVISSCAKFSEVFPPSTGYTSEQLLEIGMPRNDIFFDSKLVIGSAQKIRNMYSIKPDDYIVLFAPTFRGHSNNASHSQMLDYDLLKTSIQKRFNKRAVMFFRGHYFLANNEQSADIINVSTYPDMQELLCAADIFITDYSSCMWDFALTHKPGFLFTPDMAQYENDRGVYTPISTWPFPYAKTTEELCSLVETYNEEIATQKAQRHLETLGSFEDGHATERVCEIINDFMNKE